MLNRISQHIVNYALITAPIKRLVSVQISKALVSLALCFVTLTACSGGQNFTQFPGFVEYFENHPPADHAPSAVDVNLLKTHKPRIFKANGQLGPIDFYKDYISHGELSVDGEKIDQVNAERLKQHQDNLKAIFKYNGNYKAAGTSTVYGRIDRQQIEHGGDTYEFTFLTYNLVFPVSGILKGLGTLQSAALTIGGNLNDWHQLDHYVGVTLALLDSKPVAMTLQQHNYHTTYLLEPLMQNVEVDIAMRSNELYPHTAEETRHPAVSFLSPDNIGFLLTGNDKPMMAGYDITHGEEEIQYQLAFLPQTDAFYQFKGSLGKPRLLPGRSGPPGADYATLPGLMPRAIRLVTGYRSNDVELEVDLFGELFNRENFSIRQHAIKPYQDRFFEAISN